MTLWIATLHRAVRMKIPLMNMRKTQLPRIKILPTITKTEAVTSAAGEKKLT